jgi:hypothetical protein
VSKQCADRTAKVIVALTVRQILDEQIAMKLACRAPERGSNAHPTGGIELTLTQWKQYVIEGSQSQARDVTLEGL